ncbi:hypothetical protein KKD19_04855 [Patescibacteria group bacterium]|nr:hypothetical protein [Patescibacteria group bacterium]MBU4512539.1 hypothetical protein [Patescibacteria group bacterium]MCG2692680.1 hypothetical protein [Candidatus Parcubacteria bacterium]
MQDNIQKQNTKQLVYNWITANTGKADIPDDYYCESRDIFQARLDSMLLNLLSGGIPEESAYIISAIAGEIGNNSFDHNLGSWPDIMGIFFAYDVIDSKAEIFLADRGQGVFNTLKKVKKTLTTDTEALRVAFTERISGRTPENRGNGLKFVKESVKDKKMNLIFMSGNAQAELNEEMTIKEIDKNISGCLAILKYKS